MNVCAEKTRERRCLSSPFAISALRCRRLFFSGLDLTLNAGDRVGLVAANGRGKSTLLRCVAKTHDPTEGHVTRSAGLRIGHVEQEAPPALLDLSFYDAVLTALPPEQAKSESWRVDVALELIEARTRCAGGNCGR